MKTDANDIIQFMKRFVAGWFIFVISTITVLADNYYNVQSLTDNVSQINSSGGDVVINLVFDSDIVTSNPNNSVWDFNGLNLSGISIIGKSTSTKIAQSSTRGRLLNIASLPNNVSKLNFSNLNLSSFTFLDTITDASITSRTGGAFNIIGGVSAQVATFNNMIFNDNRISVTTNNANSFNASGGGLYMSGGTVNSASGKNVTLNKIDFTNNSVTLLDPAYSIVRQIKTATGGGAAIRYYDYVKFAEGNVVGNFVSANIKGNVAGGGLYLSGVGNGSSISKFNFTNNSSTLQNGGEGIAFAGALFAEQEYVGLVNSNNLTIAKTTLNISETNFRNNNTTNYGTGEALGGAVVLLRDLDGVFNKVIFENNSVQSNSSYARGGAIAIHSFYQDSIPLAIADVNNIRSQVSKFNETIFTNNEAVSALSDGAGGAIFSTQRIETTKTDFIDNAAKGTSAFGGAIAITHTTASGTSYDSADMSKIQGGKFTGNQSIANGGESRGGAIYSSKGLEIVSSVTYGNVLFEENRAISNVANSARGNSIFADAGVIFNTGEGSKIEDFDGHYITGNVTKVGGGILSLLGESQHRAGSYLFREGILKSGFTKNGEAGFRAIANLDGKNSTGTITFDKGTVWELDLTNADLKKLTAGVQFADGEIIGANEALKLGNTLVDLELVNGTIKLARILDAANVSDIYASAAYLHKWNTIQQATNTRINQLLYRHGLVHGGYISGDNSQGEHRGQSFRVPVAVERIFNNAWVNYVGRKSAAESSYELYNGESFKTISNGIQFGFDLASGFGSHFGFMFGYENARGDLVNDYIRGDDYYVGVYAAMLFSYGFDIRGMLGFGHQRYRISRYDFGREREFEIKPDGNTFEINLEFGRRLQTWHNSSIRPFIAIDYLANSISSADEGVGGFRYDNLSLDQLFFRVGTDVQWHFGLLCFDAGIAFSQQLLDDFAEATISQGQISTALRTSRYGASVFTFNVGANYAFDRFRACSIYINYVGEVFVGGESESINSLHTGIQWKF
jgi:hypothetical protein